MNGLEPVGDGVWALVRAPGGWGETNTVLVVGEDAAAVVDTPWDARRAEEMMAAFTARAAGAPVTVAVNTHADPDHWWGNVVLPESCRVVTSDASLAGMRAESGPREVGALTAAASALRRVPGTVGAASGYLCQVLDGVERPTALRLPDETFSGSLDLDVGGRVLALHEDGPAHTGGDVTVHVPDAGVVVAGDLLFVGSTPILWHGPLEGWVAALDRMLGLDADLFVPGHGPVCAAGRVRELRDYWQWVAEVARPLHDDGRSPLAAARRMLVGSAMPWTTWLHPERLVITLHTLWREWRGAELAPPTTARRARAFADAARLQRALAR